MTKTKDLRLNGILYRIVIEGPHTPAERLWLIIKRHGQWARVPA